MPKSLSVTRRLKTLIDDLTARQQAAPHTPEAVYRQRCADFAERRGYFERLWSRMANIRLLLMVLALLCLGFALWQRSIWFFAATVVMLIGFAISVAQHRRLGRLRHRYAELWAVNNEGLERLQRNWSALPLRQPPGVPVGHPFAADLDLLGHASLQHLLNTTYTPVGQATLQHWLLNPANSETVRARQVAVAELATEIDIRDEIAISGRRMAVLQSNYEAFLRWAEGPLWLAQRMWLVWLARVLSVTAILSLAAWLLGILPYPIWLPIVLVNMALTAFAGRTVDEVIDQVSARQGIFRAYAELFYLLRTFPAQAPELREAQARLAASGLHADTQMRRLQRIMALADFRMFLLYAPIQWITLWNVHVLWLLERWQRVAGHETRVWLDTLGEIEALVALGVLKHDHPGWRFPEITGEPPALIIGWGMGHPLLAPDKVVANEVEIGPPGTFMLVTGSNMSGKSTLLRALGVNIVLAQAGAPVSAFYLRIPPITLGTSMRVQDSLEEGVSYFMAELRRLKSVVDAAHHAHNEGSRTLVFLLDEILHGTNTAERRVAARAVIQHLLDLGATGTVSTHDLGLVELPALARRSRPAYFTETFTRGPDGPAMSFDYTLRPGIAPSTNALKLMEIVGLPINNGELKPANLSTTTSSARANGKYYNGNGAVPHDQELDLLAELLRIAG